MKLINIICLLIGVNIVAVLASDLKIGEQFFMVLMLTVGLVLALASKYVRSRTEKMFINNRSLREIRELKNEELSSKYIVISALCVFTCLPLIG